MTDNKKISRYENLVLGYGYNPHYIVKGISRTRFAKILSNLNNNIGGVAWILDRLPCSNNNKFLNELIKKYPDRILELNDLNEIISIYNLKGEKIKKSEIK